MEGWEDKQICIKGLSDSQNEGEGRDGVINIITFPMPPPPAIHSNSKSNLVGQINDCELVTLTRPDKIPVLQAIYTVTLQYRKLIHIHIQVSCLVTQNQIQKVYSTSSEQMANS